MQTYRQRGGHSVVEAEILTEDNVDKLANIAQAQIIEEKNAQTGEVIETLNIKTPHGKARLQHGMYLVKSAGSFFVQSRGTFEALYNKMDEPRGGFDDPFKGVPRVR